MKSILKRTKVFAVTLAASLLITSCAPTTETESNLPEKIEQSAVEENETSGLQESVVPELEELTSGGSIELEDEVTEPVEMQGPIVDTLSTTEPKSNTTVAEESSTTTSTAVIEEPVPEPEPAPVASVTYVLNTKTMKFHLPSCGSLPTTNRADSAQSRDEIIAQGYVPCKKCNP